MARVLIVRGEIIKNKISTMNKCKKKKLTIKRFIIPLEREKKKIASTILKNFLSII